MHAGLLVTGNIGVFRCTWGFHLACQISALKARVRELEGELAGSRDVSGRRGGGTPLFSAGAVYCLGAGPWGVCLSTSMSL